MSEPKFLLIAANPVTFHEIAVAGGGKRLWRLGKILLFVEKSLKNTQNHGVAKRAGAF